MDLKTWAEHLDQMPMFPYFTFSHVIVCTLNSRADLGTGSLYFSRKHPFACWLSTILSIFSGNILANFLLNEPVISVLGNTQQVLWASMVWYLVFYSPFDIVHKICKITLIKVLLYSMSEIYNCKAIYQGILHAAKVFPDAYVVMAFIGIVKGNGPGFTRLLERLIRGQWSLDVIVFLRPSHSTKISTITSIVFILNRYSEWFMISQSFIFFVVVSICIYFRLSAILLDLSDPFAPVENLICLLLFGGVWDALAKAIAIDEQSQHSKASNLRARAMKADLLSGNGRPAAEKPLILTKQAT